MVKQMKNVFSLIILFHFTSIIFSQTTGKIRGKIVTEDLQPLLGVQVMINNSNIGTVSNPDGIFIFMAGSVFMAGSLMITKWNALPNDSGGEIKK